MINRGFWSPHRRNFLMVDPLPSPLVKTLSKPNKDGLYVLVGTFHGVVCLCDYHNLVIWNPSLRKFSSLPFPSFVSWDCLRLNCHGFWIDPSTKEFKAIIIQRRLVVKCILYSSFRNGWGVIPIEKLVKWSSCRKGSPVMIGGVAHWGGFLEESWCCCDHCENKHCVSVLLSFDFVQESFDVIEMPNPCRDDFALCHWQGTLSFLCLEKRGLNGFPYNCVIYLRQEDSWVKMFHCEVCAPICSLVHVFWAMEDVEERKEKGNRRRDMVERFRDLNVEPQENVRILAT